MEVAEAAEVMQGVAVKAVITRVKTRRSASHVHVGRSRREPLRQANPDLCLIADIHFCVYYKSSDMITGGIGPSAVYVMLPT